jgi:hypothetical protein
LVRQGKWAGGEIYAWSLESGGDLVENTRSSEMGGRHVVNAHDRSFYGMDMFFPSLDNQPAN